MTRLLWIAREGWGHVSLALAAAVGITAAGGGWWSAPFWVLLVFVLQFFRDPDREFPADPRVVVAPADGRVIAVGEVDDPYLKRRALCICIFMNVFNVHVNRSPVAGRVIERWYRRGRFFNAALDKAAVENERNALWVRTAEGHEVVFVQIAGLIARRILCYKQAGSPITRGERYGFIRFGSRVDVYLPVGFVPKVALGDRVSGGSGVLAVPG